MIRMLERKNILKSRHFQKFIKKIGAFKVANYNIDVRVTFKKKTRYFFLFIRPKHDIAERN